MVKSEVPTTSLTGAARPSRAALATFDQLDASVPLLLLPVRIETIFRPMVAPARARSKRAQENTQSLELLVRIYPDQIHADTHVQALAPEEDELGKRFWQQAWPTTSTRKRQERAFTNLASSLGPFRAAWVLEATRPLNWDRRDAVDKSHQPRFAEPPKRNGNSPGRARLLPDHWMVSGYQRNGLLFAKNGKPIPRELAISPDFAGTGPAPKSMADLLSAQGLAWMNDFAAAEEVGMAVRIRLDERYLPRDGLDLIVVGARTADTPDIVSRKFADLLAAHHWTHGVDFVRRGTPTNNSDRAQSGVSLSEPDLAALLDSVLARPDPRARAAEPLHRRRFDDAASLALGLEPGSILERVSQRDDAMLDLAGAMSAALWPATWGYFLRTMLGDAVDDQWIAWLRRHFITRVKPGGLLPAIRVGNQPYGLLPVSQEQLREPATEKTDILENLLLGLLPAWDAAVEHRVARLDVDAPDTPQDGNADTNALGAATATLARILGATPNPSDLTLAPLTNQHDLYASAWGLIIFLLDFAISPKFPEIASQLGDDLAEAKTLEAQITVLEAVIRAGSGATPLLPSGELWDEAHSTTNDSDTTAAAQSAITLIDVYVLPLLYGHRDRVSAIIDRGPDRTKVTGEMAERNDPPLFFSLFGESEERIPWAGPLVVRDAGTIEEVRTWLDALLAEAHDPAQPATAPGQHAPLLFQLLKRAIEVVHDADRGDMRAGLAALAAAVKDGRAIDPIADLELLMNEVLGACMHRLDAWLSAGAAERLEAARLAKPRGIEVGGYGWVVGLKPSSASSPSQGFIHAPSLDHAATAAIIRSGWSALGDGALGIDVSSSRARAASWIVDGVRDGHRLGELLGQSLERRLHDAFLDRHIEPIRSAVLRATGRAGEQPVAIVDGFVVARAWLGGDEVAPLTAEETETRKAMIAVAKGAGDDETSLRAALDLHAADLDAVADASLFASVHAIVRGNTPRAAATLAATGDAASAPPPLTALRTSRSGQRIEHRIVLLLDGTVTDEQATSPPAIAEPILEDWIGKALPLANIGFGIWREESGVKTWEGPHNLGQTGIGALELLASLPSVEGFSPGSALARRLAWKFEREAANAGRTTKVTIDAELTGGDGVDKLPLALALAAARSLQALIHSGRALNDSDLATVKLDSTADAGRIGSRADNLIDAARDAEFRLRTAIDNTATTAEIVDACAAFATWQIAGAIPRAGLTDLASGSDLADREALLREAEMIHGRVQARLDSHDAVRGNDLASSLSRMHALLPGVVILPPVAPADMDAIRTSAARSTTRLGAPEQAMPWLHQVGRVRERVQDAAVAADLVEAAAGVNKFQPTLIQFPDHADEGWAATSKPTVDTGQRTCIFSLTPLPTSTSLAGLAIDAWTEVIPDETATTGIALHFDAPSARAPQAWLIASPPRGKAWTHDDVLAVVRQTLERARQRAVSPDEIEGYGQYLPAAYLADTIDPGPVRMKERTA